MNELVNCEQKIIIDNQRKLFVSSVESVDGFNEETLKLTVAGKKLIIKGTKIKITQFNKMNGNFSADGLFYQLNFAKENTPILKKIFK